MHTRRILVTLIAASSLLLVGVSAFAADTTMCATLSPGAKAKCEWKQKQDARNAGAQTSSRAPSMEETLNLPSCVRMSGQAKATCEVSNHKAIQDALKGMKMSSSS